MAKYSLGLKSALAFSVGCGALLSGGPALAQDAGGEEATKRLDAVITTAGKREQTLQDIPVAVSVVDAETLAESQIIDIVDLQTVVPSLRVSQLQQAGNTSFSIRGFGNGSNNVGTEPAVAVFIDGVYRSRAAGALGDYPDLKRIEVLKGPQSTLFGKNASVGVISVVTEQPEFELGGNLSATIGNYGSTILKGRLTGPITDTLAFSVSGSMNKRDGFAVNEFDGSDLNERDRSSVKAQLLYQPNDAFSLRVIADHDELDESCCYVPNIEQGVTAQVINALDPTALVTDPFGYRTVINTNPTNTLENNGLSVQADWETGAGTVTSITSFRTQDSVSDGDVDFTGLDLIQRNLLDYDTETFTQELRLSGSKDKLDYVVGAFYLNEDLTQNTSLLFGQDFRTFADARALADLGVPNASGTLETLLGQTLGSFYLPGTGTEESFTQDNESYSLFAQGDYHINDKLTLTLGAAFIDDEKTVTGSAVNTDTFAAIDLATAFDNAGILTAASPLIFGADYATQVLPLAAFAGLTGQTFAADTIGALTTSLAATQAAALGGDTTAQAILANLSNPVVLAAAQTGIAAELGSQVSALQFLPGFVDFPNAVEGNSFSDDHLTYTARLAYDVNDNVNVYGSWSTGYKAASWQLTRDSSFLPEDEAALQALSLVPANKGPGTRFALPEESEVLELGAKMSFDNFNINLAIFDQTVENFQSTIFQGTTFVLSNAGEQSTQGFEWDAVWYPTDALQFTLSGVHQDPEYDSFLGAPVPEGSALDLADGVADGSGDLSGRAPAGIPETTLYTSARYDFGVAEGVDGFVRAGYEYASEVQVVDNVEGLTREVGTIDASVGFNWDNGLSVLLWGKNLNEDEYFTSGIPGPAQPGNVYAYPNAPQTYGVTLRTEF